MIEKKILVIDDEEAICLVLKEWLTLQKYEVIYKISAQEGLDCFAQSSFPLVILDIRMPGIDGLSVLKKIKELNPDTVVLLMTGFPSDDTIGEALKNGAYDYLVKPFQVDKISYLIDRAYAFAQLKDNARNKKI
jgi:DNA-binding NtrC family response regulator